MSNFVCVIEAKLLATGWRLEDRVIVVRKLIFGLLKAISVAILLQIALLCVFGAVQAGEPSSVTGVNLLQQQAFNFRLMEELTKPRISDKFRERILNGKMSAKDRAYLDSAMKAWRAPSQMTFQATMDSFFIHFDAGPSVSLKVKSSNPLILLLNEKIEIEIEKNEIRESIRKSLKKEFGIPEKKSAILEILRRFAGIEAQASALGEWSSLATLIGIYAADRNNGYEYIPPRNGQNSAAVATAQLYSRSRLHTGLGNELTRRFTSGIEMSCGASGSLSTAGQWASGTNFTARYTADDGSNSSRAYAVFTTPERRGRGGQVYRVSLRPDSESRPCDTDDAFSWCRNADDRSNLFLENCRNLRQASSNRHGYGVAYNPVLRAQYERALQAAASSVCVRLPPRTLSRLREATLAQPIKELCLKPDCSETRELTLEEEVELSLEASATSRARSLVGRVRSWRPRSSPGVAFQLNCEDLSRCEYNNSINQLSQRDRIEIHDLLREVRDLHLDLQIELRRKGIHRDFYALGGFSTCCGDTQCRREIQAGTGVNLRPSDGATRAE